MFVLLGVIGPFVPKDCLAEGDGVPSGAEALWQFAEPWKMDGEGFAANGGGSACIGGGSGD